MSDNKKYIGKIDRIRVSMSEEYEVDYYVEQYIKTRGYTNSAENKQALHEHLNQYPHSGTVMRDALTSWLDARLKK
jgi:hypothetical protein